MRSRRGFTLAELVFFIVVLVGLFALLVAVVLHQRAVAEEAARRAGCIGSLRNVGLALVQYADDHDGRYPPLVDATGNVVPAVDNAGVVSSLPARTGFVVLLHEGYLTTTKVFICPSSGERVNRMWDYETDYQKVKPAELAAGFKAENCSYGWDPTKTHAADAGCAIVADKPPGNVLSANEGRTGNNSPNHKGEGQNVFYNDGHVKWATTPTPDSGDDPDIYTGARGYEKSTTDAKIIR